MLKISPSTSEKVFSTWMCRWSLLPSTHREEHPLNHLSVFTRRFFHVPAELVVCIVVFLEIQQDRSSFEYSKVISAAIHDGGDPTVGVDGDVPWFLEGIRVGMGMCSKCKKY